MKINRSAAAVMAAAVVAGWLALKAPMLSPFKFRMARLPMAPSGSAPCPSMGKSETIHKIEITPPLPVLKNDLRGNLGLTYDMYSSSDMMAALEFSEMDSKVNRAVNNYDGRFFFYCNRLPIEWNDHRS